MSEPIENTQWKNTQKKIDIHKKRCETDPIYQILLFPDELVDGIKFIDRIISKVKLMLEKKYGETFKSDKLIETMFRQLESSYCDSDIKVFFLLFAIKWEPEVCDAIREFYDEDSPMFGKRGEEQFNHLLRLLDRWIKQTQNYPYSQFNIVPIVKNFLAVSTLEYIMGPFQ